jgi:diacylglycerol kinase (ATP)
LEAALKTAAIAYEVSETEAPGHGREIARELRQSSLDRLLVVGGDGTIHEVVNGLLESDAAFPSALPPDLAILAMGTGNDFNRMIRAPKGIEGAIRVLREGVATPFDVGYAEWEGGGGYFVNLVGVGIDVAVLQARASYSVLPGLLQYLAAFGSALRSYRPVPVTATLFREGAPSVTVEGEALLAAVTVGPSIGGGFIIAPQASAEDGLLDFFLAKRMRVLRLAKYLQGILRGTSLEGEEVVQTQVTSVRLVSTDGRPLFFEMDGEWMATSTPFLKIRVIPRGLRILELPQG